MKNKMLLTLLMLFAGTTLHASQTAIKQEIVNFFKTNPNTWQDADIARIRNLISKYPKSGQAAYTLELEKKLEEKNRTIQAQSSATTTRATGSSQQSTQGGTGGITTQGTGYIPASTAATISGQGEQRQVTERVTTEPTKRSVIPQAPEAPTAQQRATTALQTQEIPSAPLAPEAPEAPEAPQAPSAPEDITKKKPEDKKPTTQKPTGLKPLTEKELAALSPEEKRASDRVFTEALLALAKSFDAFEKYKRDIKAALSTIVEKNEQFKKRQELTTVITSLDKFITDNLTYSKNLQVNSALEGMSKLIAPCVFDAQAFTQNMGVYLPILVVNIAASQRTTIETPNNAQAIASDGQAHDIIEEIIKAVSEDQGYKAFEIAFKKAAEEQKAKALENKAPKTEEKPIKATLSKDYFMELHAKINLLRLQPTFLKFVPLIKRLKDVADPVAKLQTTPVLFLLLATDSAVLNPRLIQGALSTQLLYSPDTMNDFMPKESLALRAMIDDHIQRLKTFKKSALDDFLNDRLAFAKAVRDIVNALEEAKAGAELQGSNAKDLADLVATLKTYSPDAKLLGEKLTAFGVKSEILKTILAIVGTYAKEKAVASKAADILKLAQAEFKKTKQPVGFLIIQELEKQQLLGANRLQRIKGLGRTPEAVQQAFVGLIGSMDEVNKLAKKEDFYKWIEPYGTLFEILKSAQDKFKEIQKNQEKFDLLIASLTALNDAKILPNKPYAPAITTAKGLIDTGVFKGKLTNLIQTLQEYSIASADTELATIAGDASKLPEFTEFKNELNRNLVAIMHDLLKIDVSKLNAGTAELAIPGLELESVTASTRGRNGAVYTAWAGIFKDLITLLSKDITQLDLAQFDTEKAKITKAANSKLEAANIKYLSTPTAKEQKEAIVNALTTYLDIIKTKLGYLKAVATVQAPEVKHKEEVSSGIPEAPLMEGEIPEAPPE